MMSEPSLDPAEVDATGSQVEDSGCPGERGALAHLSHLADDFGTEDIRAVREEMADKSEWTQ